MTAKEKLLKLLPKRYRHIVQAFEPESDLADGCKYMLCWTDDYTDDWASGRGACFPTRSIKEAADYVRNSLYRFEK